MLIAHLTVAALAIATTLAPPTPAADVALTVDALLAEVKARAPALVSARASLAVTAADEEGAGVWPNPSASYNFAGTVAGVDTLGGTQHAIDIAVPLLIAGQAGVRVEAAHAATFAAEADLRAAAADLEHDARSAFDDLLVAQARLDISAAALKELLEAEKIVGARESNGSGSRYDMLRIAAAVAAQQAALGDEQQKLLDAQAHVATLLGKPGYAPHAVGDLVAGSMPDAPFQPERLWPVAGAERRIEAKKKALAKAEREAWPIPSVSAGSFVTTGTGTGGGVAVLAGIPSDIPVFDRNQGPIAHAKAEVTEAEAQERQILVEAQAAWQAARTAATRADQSLKDFDGRTGGDQIKNLRGMAREGYQSSKQSILELVDALAAIVNVELQRADLIGTARRTRLELQRTAGALGDAVLPATEAVR